MGSINSTNSAYVPPVSYHLQTRNKCCFVIVKHVVYFPHEKGTARNQPLFKGSSQKDPCLGAQHRNLVGHRRHLGYPRRKERKVHLRGEIRYASCSSNKDLSMTSLKSDCIG